MTDSARLFMGIELSHEVRAALRAFRRELADCTIGKLVDPALYHLTLNFLGLTPRERIPALCGLMDEVQFNPFGLALAQAGMFRGGSILWVGIEEPCDELHALQSALTAALNDAGFPVERGAYSPHITLGRQMKRLADLPEPPTGSFVVNHITLFESARIEGRLIYVPLHRSNPRRHN